MKRVLVLASIAIIAVVPLSSPALSGALFVAQGPAVYAEIDNGSDFARIDAYQGPGLLTYVNEFLQARAVTAPFACLYVFHYNSPNHQVDVGCGRAKVSVAPDGSTATASGGFASVMYTEDTFQGSSILGGSPVRSTISFSVTWTATSACGDIEILGFCYGPGLNDRGERFADASGYVSSSALGLTVSGSGGGYTWRQCCGVGLRQWPSIDYFNPI